jgi:hypothetical protein
MKLVWCPPGFVTMESVESISEPAGHEPKRNSISETTSRNLANSQQFPDCKEFR